MRAKWNEKHYSDRRTYGGGTIAAAMTGKTPSAGYRRQRAKPAPRSETSKPGDGGDGHSFTSSELLEPAKSGTVTDLPRIVQDMRYLEDCGARNSERGALFKQLKGSTARRRSTSRKTGPLRLAASRLTCIASLPRCAKSSSLRCTRSAATRHACGAYATWETLRHNRHQRPGHANSNTLDGKISMTVSSTPCVTMCR